MYRGPRALASLPARPRARPSQALAELVAACDELLAQQLLRLGHAAQLIHQHLLRLVVLAFVGEQLRQLPRRGEAVRVVAPQQAAREAQALAQEGLGLGRWARPLAREASI